MRDLCRRCRRFALSFIAQCYPVCRCVRLGIFNAPDQLPARFYGFSLPPRVIVKPWRGSGWPWVAYSAPVFKFHFFNVGATSKGRALKNTDNQRKKNLCARSPFRQGYTDKICSGLNGLKTKRFKYFISFFKVINLHV